MLFGLVIAASLLNNICFIALKVVRVHEQNLWREGNFDINEVQRQQPAAVRQQHGAPTFNYFRRRTKVADLCFILV